MPVCVHCATPLPDGSQFCSQCGTPVPGRRPDDPTFTPQGREIYERLKEATEGKYKIIRELGRGGMAVVFLGYQKSLDREVAIKVLLPLLGYDPEIVERFTREARTQGKLDHPNIIQVYEIYNEGGLTFFTVPYISGESMRVYLRDYPQPPLEKVFRYLTQAADALAYAHRRGVVHRDVKPDNILVDRERDRVILTDFGIAKALTAEKTLTTPGDLLGTPQYMSPEQGEGRHDLDGRADQYSLGLIGYEMLAGHRPFLADNLAELMYKHRFEEPPSLDDIRSDAPRHLREAIHRAISKDRDERFPTMDAFLTSLEGPWEVEMAEDDEEGRTEPMPPPGSDATTVRVPTPPSTPRPAAVDDTAPETAEPPAELEPTLKTPEPWEAADEPTVKTPEPLAAPVGEPPAEAEEPDEPWSVSGTQPWETPAEAVAEAAAEVEEPIGPLLGEARRPRAPRALLFGGGAVVVAAGAALIVLGPLGSGGESIPSEPLSMEETGPAAAGGEGTTEQGTGETTTGAVPGEGESPGPGDQPLAEGTPAADVEEVAAEPVVEDRPADQPGQPPVIGDTPPEVPRDADPRAVRAMEGAYRWRNAAIAAGVAEANLVALDRRMDQADRLMDAGQYSEARSIYSGLVPEYTDFAEAAAPVAAAEQEQPTPAEEEQPPPAQVEPPQPAVDEAMRVEADQARTQVGRQRESAIRAGAQGFLAAELQQVDARRSEAERAFNEGRFEAARDGFLPLAAEYEGLASRATRLRLQLTEAKDSMQTVRGAALDAGAQQYAADAWDNAEGLRQQAEGQEGNGALAAAAPLYGQARDAYARAVEDALAAAAAAAAAAEEPAPEPPAEEEPAAVPAEVTITGLIEVFRQAFEQEDLNRMSADLYRGPVPGGDARIYNAFFDRADDLRAQTDIRRLEVSEDGNRATADVEFATTFRQARMGTRGSQDVTFRMRFVLDAGGWRLERAELL
ncbi:MAG: protein kinase [Gemmatimonadota bacterium]|nr:MAG: protein kinase [Gemmatimonadota bacterium]